MIFAKTLMCLFSVPKVHAISGNVSQHETYIRANHHNSKIPMCWFCRDWCLKSSTFLPLLPKSAFFEQFCVQMIQTALEEWFQFCVKMNFLDFHQITMMLKNHVNPQFTILFIDFNVSWNIIYGGSPAPSGSAKMPQTVPDAIEFSLHLFPPLPFFFPCVRNF